MIVSINDIRKYEYMVKPDYKPVYGDMEGIMQAILKDMYSRGVDKAQNGFKLTSGDKTIDYAKPCYTCSKYHLERVLNEAGFDLVNTKVEPL